MGLGDCLFPIEDSSFLLKDCLRGSWVLDCLKIARLWLGKTEGYGSWVLHGFWVFVLILELKGRNPSGCLWLGNGFGYESQLVIRQ